jgi:hypothetical protein
MQKKFCINKLRIWMMNLFTHLIPGRILMTMRQKPFREVIYLSRYVFIRISFEEKLFEMFFNQVADIIAQKEIHVPFTLEGLTSMQRLNLWRLAIHLLKIISVFHDTFVVEVVVDDVDAQRFSQVQPSDQYCLHRFSDQCPRDNWFKTSNIQRLKILFFNPFAFVFYFFVSVVF